MYQTILQYVYELIWSENVLSNHQHVAQAAERSESDVTNAVEQVAELLVFGLPKSESEHNALSFCAA